MICRSCNRNLPPRARYCVHCGAEQDVPTPIAFAAAMAGVRREAANAVYAEAAPPGRGDAGRPDTHGDRARARDARGVWNDHGAARGPAGSNEVDSAPAYANAPSRYRLATALIVACLVVGAVGLTAAWWLRPAPPLAEQAPNSAATAQAPAATGSNRSAEPAETTSPTVDHATTSAPGVPEHPPAATAEAPASTENAPSSAPESSVQAPVEITPLPPHRAAPRSHAAPHAEPANPQAPRSADAEPARATPEPAPKQRAAASTPPAVTAAAPVDRWTRMKDEMSNCTREDFIARVICGQRVRFRYCDGYWGKVPACPGSPAPERGQ